MKKICFVMPQMYPLLSGFKDNKIIGGSEMQVDRIADTLDKKKYEICFIVNEKGDDEILNGKKIVKFSGNNHISIYLSFIKAFIRADADTYYQRIGGMITGFCGILSKICKKKFIHAVAWDRQCEKNNFSLLRHISYNIGIKSADVVISQSEYQKELLKKNFNRKSIVIKSIYVIKTKEKPQKKNFILWGSTIDKTKQPDLFLRLAEQLPEYKFIMFGGKRMNEESTYSKIKQKAKKIK
ncbi:MAG: hypothetical protein KAI55_04245, partial [Candidatus Aenigmarchaeota archaeon]|nr:hypothetical protein [Candidatus Aenigmarchaeota archaeon]